MFKNVKRVHRIIMMAVAEYLSSSQVKLFSEQLTHIEFVVKNFTDEITTVVENVNQTVNSEETTASTEEATSAMIEQKNGIENLNEYGKKLSNLTLELNSAVNQFKV